MGKPLRTLEFSEHVGNFRLFFRQTMNQLRINLVTQYIYPMEVYRGYAAINQKRKEMGQWYSTGEGAKSFDGDWQAYTDGQVGMKFMFADYLRFVDMGVGQGTKADDVDSSRSARYKTRYTRKWNRLQGKSQRPALMMELRHLQTRLDNYLSDFYGNKAGTILVRSFEGIGPIEIV